MRLIDFARRAIGALALLAIADFAGAAGPATAARLRADFVAAEHAIETGRDARFRKLREALDGYPLAPYLDLEWHLRRLASVPDERVAEILDRHADVPVSFRLRRAWERRLAATGHWRTLLARHVVGDTMAGDCRAAEAAWRVGRTDEAWARIESLWPTGESLPDECDAVLEAWRDAGRLGDALAWERAALAIEAGNPALARYLARFLDPQARDLLDRWLELRAHPHRVAGFAAAARVSDPRVERIVRHVFDRLAARDPDRAIRQWNALPQRLRATPLGTSLRMRVGVALAREQRDEALRWLDGATSPDVVEWSAVAAIRAGDWRRLLDALQAMPPDERERERWRYWRARGLDALGDHRAGALLTSLATERSYYGFLAADRVDAPYRLSHATLTAPAAVRESLARDPALARIVELRALGRTIDARREWEHLLERLDDDGRRAAAALAARWQWHEAAIRAAAQARAWDDLDVRFPLAFGDEVAQAAQASGLPVPRVLAVARQESAFMTDARSSAGALGLMQLLPRTARQVARRAALRRPSTSALLEPETNLLLGSLYLGALERRYGNHPVLASAAYNAGPARVRRWRPTHGELASERWIDSIPFRETRRYVRAVLAYQAIYAHRMGSSGARLERWMPPVPATGG